MPHKTLARLSNASLHQLSLSLLPLFHVPPCARLTNPCTHCPSIVHFPRLLFSYRLPRHALPLSAQVARCERSVNGVMVATRGVPYAGVAYTPVSCAIDMLHYILRTSSRYGGKQRLASTPSCSACGPGVTRRHAPAWRLLTCWRSTRLCLFKRHPYLCPFCVAVLLSLARHAAQAVFRLRRPCFGCVTQTRAPQ